MKIINYFTISAIFIDIKSNPTKRNKIIKILLFISPKNSCVLILEIKNDTKIQENYRGEVVLYFFEHSD